MAPMTSMRYGRRHGKNSIHEGVSPVEKHKHRQSRPRPGETSYSKKDRHYATKSQRPPVARQCPCHDFCSCQDQPPHKVEPPSIRVSNWCASQENPVQLSIHCTNGILQIGV